MSKGETRYYKQAQECREAELINDWRLSRLGEWKQASNMIYYAYPSRDRWAWQLNPFEGSSGFKKHMDMDFLAMG